MDLRKLKKLIDLVEESGIAELEVTEGEEKVRITRVQAGGQTTYYAPQPMAQQVAVAATPAAAAPDGSDLGRVGGGAGPGRSGVDRPLGLGR